MVTAAHPGSCPYTLLGAFKRIGEVPSGYLLKICVFQGAALKGRCSRLVVFPILIAVIKIWQRYHGAAQQIRAIDSNRIAKTMNFLSEFAEDKVARAADGTLVHWRLFRAETFHRWVEANGGVRDGEWIRPRRPEDWQRLQRLREFKWFEEVGQSFRVPMQVPGAENTCVLRCQGFGRTIPMDKPFIGLHLAAGFNYAIFDWREEPSLKGYFQDAEACYQAVRQEGFAAGQIKAVGTCRSTFVVSRLKELHHAEGMDAVLLQAPSSLRAMIENQIFLARWIGLLGLGEIEKDGEDCDTLRRLRGLQPGPGRLCLVMSEGDKTLPANTTELIRNAALHAGPCEVIWEPSRQDGGDPHFEEPLRNAAVLQRYSEFLAGNVR